MEKRRLEGEVARLRQSLARSEELLNARERLSGGEPQGLLYSRGCCPSPCLCAVVVVAWVRWGWKAEVGWGGEREGMCTNLGGGPQGLVQHISWCTKSERVSTTDADHVLPPAGSGMSATVGISALYRSPDTTALVAALKEQV